MKKVYLFILTILSITVIHAQDQCKVVGWGTQNGGVTGGGSATPTVVTTYAALKTALTTSSVKVVHVSGTITFPTAGRITIQDTDGKTIIGLPGSRMISVDKTSDGSGILYIKRSTNFIMRNLTFEGPGAYDTDGNDNLTVDACQNFWVDHCDFQDGMDGNFDIKNASDYISVTWCKFTYLKAPIPNGPGGSDDHRYTNLIGSSDGATGDAGKLRITFQYCWWGQGCVERMPRVRFGKVHMVNNLFNSTVSNNVIRAGYKADLLIESNVFIGVNKPIDLFENDFTGVTARNNIFTNTSGNTAGSGTAFTPPYTLTISAASSVQSLVTNTACGSGATLDSPTQCGCGTPVNVAPVASITAPATASKGCVGTAIAITATATDDVSVSKVDFYNGNTLLGTDNSSPYSFSYTPTAEGTLTLKAIATDNAGLTGTSANVTVTVSALPTPTITSSTTNLCTTSPIVLSTTTGASYKWFNGTTQVGTDATFSAIQPGTYTVEVTNAGGCKATSGVRTLTGTAQATPTITSSTTNLCTTSPIVLSTTTGASYKWFNGTTQVGTDATFTATQPGTYTVEVTNAGGCKATSAVRTLTGTAQATPTITSSTTNLCTTSPIVLSTTTGASYKWFNGTTQVGTDATFSAIQPGTYTVEVTNAGGCKATSGVRTLTGTAQATPTITSSTTNLCTTSPIVLSTTSGASYKWFNGTTQVGTDATFTATQPGTYTVEVTNAGGCKATSAVRTLTGTAQATPAITSSTTNLCTTGSIVLSTTSGASYKWFNGTTQVGTDATFTATQPGTYTVEVTNAGGCKATSAVRTLTGTAQATPTITSSTTNLCATSPIVLSTTTGASYKWFNGTTQVGTDATFSATQPGTYTVEVTNAGGCKATSAVRTLTGTSQATPTITSSTTNLCTTSPIVLSTTTGASYKWFNGTTQVGTDATFTATQPGTYTVEVTNAGGCKATSGVRTITGTAQATPTITSSTTNLCTTGSIVLSTTSGASYKWFNGTTQVGTDATFTATQPGTYTVEVTNAGGCKATSNETIIPPASSPTATITAQTTSICEGSSVTLIASAGNSYKWFNGTTQVGTAPTYSATTAGSYTVDVTNAGDCKAISAVITITVSAAPAATITGPAYICAGSSITLTSSVATSYKWFNGTTQVGTGFNYTTTVPGEYSVEVTNAAGCKATSAVKTITTNQLSVWYEDADGDGFGDPKSSLTVCWQPTKYVSVAGDGCPTDPNKTTPGICGCGVVENTCIPTATVNGTSSNITVTPQPFEDNTKIELINYGIIKSITVISTSGATVETITDINSEEVLVGESLASGLYTVIIQSDKAVYTTKIVKK